MTISATQIREARALLGWGTPTLARRASVGLEVVLRAQNVGAEPPVVGMDLRAIRDAFERAGVIFIDENGEGPGVRLRKVEPS
ncbi:transcriptional regulator [Lichenibacterium minor]|uniref:Transcriptional regulator n=1 Tax=Lichenibacterium minor TaxID=2316528 RepID=A0A4Q2TYL8_9HYPH|nr:transcriptional regulator [Lichenibacterium minor]RYC29209.1 transcriptional regulator [Lichenibacterium minor]